MVPNPEEFKLRTSSISHEKDVRGITASLFPEGGIITASRDVTTRLWMPNEGDVHYTEHHRMSGHSNFVMCVTVLLPDDKYPQGLIVTGGLDHEIIAYTLESPSPQYRLKGHSHCVCSLAAGKFGTLVSGSWDNTAKVWLNQKCVMTLEGHKAAVWAVAIIPQEGLMLTGSADKSIRLWRAGKTERHFTGHEDCVRGITVLSPSEFLSCSNDASVRRWSISGECLFVYVGHTNYVYGLALLSNGLDFVSVGEDHTMRVWRQGQCTQVVNHPCTSVWCVCVLSNGDIATGSSDGIVRVFTSDPSRMASEDEQKVFEEMNAAAHQNTKIGDLKLEDLPGPEILINPGRRDGQTVMVRRGMTAEAHQWSAEEQKWKQIGDVVGGTGGTTITSGKELFKGKEYDYIFNIDLHEGQPPLKLPYNKSEDPWLAAHNFLAENDVSQMFLDKVANFIIENTTDITLGGPAPPTALDPFTGGGSYRSGTAAPPTGPAIENKFFPQTSYVTIETGNIKPILEKLSEFSTKAGKTLDSTTLTRLGQVAEGRESSPQFLALFTDLLSWPPYLLFPALDLLRLGVCHAPVNKHVFSTGDLLPFLLNHVRLSGVNQMLCLRVLANGFSGEAGERLLIAQKPAVLDAVIVGAADANKLGLLAASTILLNFAVAMRRANAAETLGQCLEAISALVGLPNLTPEATFRLLVAMGTIVDKNEVAVAMASSLCLDEFVRNQIPVQEPAKVGECASLVNKVLSAMSS